MPFGEICDHFLLLYTETEDAVSGRVGEPGLTSACGTDLPVRLSSQFPSTDPERDSRSDFGNVITKGLLTFSGFRKSIWQDEKLTNIQLG